MNRPRNKNGKAGKHKNPTASRANIKVLQFGRFEVWLGDKLMPNQAWGRRKTQSLFKLLMSERGKVFSADSLIDALFPDHQTEKAMVNLRGRVGELRRALEPELKKNVQSQYVLTADGGGYYLSDSEDFWVDTETFANNVEQALSNLGIERWQAALEELLQASDLYRGEYLEEDPYEEWTLPIREAFRQQLAMVHERTAHIQESLGRFSEAIEACRRALNIDPFQEAVHRRLMRSHYRLGNRGDAIKAYETCRQTLNRHLNATPAKETLELHEKIVSKTLSVKVDPVIDKSAKSIAVLPLTNLGGSSDSDYFSDGLTEDIIAQLSKIQTLKVISRTSAMAYKNSDKAVRDIGRELGVAHVLEGSVRQSNNAVRVVAQLINARTEELLWGETYDRRLDDLFAVQSEIADNIAHALRVQVSDSERTHMRRAPTANMAVYELYLKGRHKLNESTEQSYQQAIKLLQQAVQQDPHFALGYATLAECFDSLSFFNLLPHKEGYLRVKEMALKALEIDPHLGEAYAGLANVRMFFEWDWSGAKEALGKSITLSPGFAVAHSQLSRWWLYQSDFTQAQLSMDQAIELDPLSQTFSRDKGYVLVFSKQYDQAIQHLGGVLRKYANDRYMHFLLGMALLFGDDSKKAIESFNAAEELSGSDPYLRMCLSANKGIAHAQLHQTDLAQEAYQTLEEGKQLRDRASIMATLAFALGKSDMGFEWLTQAIDNRDPWLCHLNIWPLSDSTARHDPRFGKVLKQVGLTNSA